jgi:hypothetical protein
MPTPIPSYPASAVTAAMAAMAAVSADRIAEVMTHAYGDMNRPDRARFRREVADRQYGVRVGASYGGLTQPSVWLTFDQNRSQAEQLGIVEFARHIRPTEVVVSPSVVEREPRLLRLIFIDAADQYTQHRNFVLGFPAEGTLFTAVGTVYTYTGNFQNLSPLIPHQHFGSLGRAVDWIYRNLPYVPAREQTAPSAHVADPAQGWDEPEPYRTLRTPRAPTGVDELDEVLAPYSGLMARTVTRQQQQQQQQQPLIPADSSTLLRMMRSTLALLLDVQRGLPGNMELDEAVNSLTATLQRHVPNFQTWLNDEQGV